MTTAYGRERTYRTRAVEVIEWTVRDFKALEHATLPLAPFNVLVGANSSGKSSLIQSLLLLAQSTDQETILNGPLVRLGDPADVVRAGQDRLAFGYSFRQEVADGQEALVSVDMLLKPLEGNLVVADFAAEVDGRQLLRTSSRRISETTAMAVSERGRLGDCLLRVNEIDGRPAPAWTFVSFRGLTPNALIYKRTRKQVVAELRKSTKPASFQADPDTAIQISRELIDWLRTPDSARYVSQQTREFLQSTPRAAMSFLSSLSTAELDELYVQYATSLPEQEWIPIPVDRFALGYGRSAARHGIFGPVAIPQVLQAAATTLGAAAEATTTLRDSIRYLGPLREEPQVVSAAGGRNRALPAGPKGEYTADLLARQQARTIQFRDWEAKRRRSTLSAAVTLWTGYLGVGEGVSVEDQGKLGRGLRILVGGVERDLTMIGVGASQVIPVLAAVLSAEPGTTVLLEQPELHLHPAVQSRLADFFLLARPDLRVVVETHSEYLITRLRRRVAERLIEPSQVAVLFAEQEDGTSNIRRLRLNELGDFSEWPKGFFDTQDEEGRALVHAVRQALQEQENGEATS